MKKSTKRILQAFAGLAIAGLAGCGDGGDTINLPDVIADLLPPPAAATDRYSGPGSQWDVELVNDGTFTITRRPAPGTPIDLTVDGTYERTDFGFVLLTVGSGTGPDAPETGDVAWAVEAPGYALMLHTDGDRFIPMLEAGTCPEADMLSNWVVARTRLESDPTETDGDYFGSFEFVASTGVASLPSRYALSDNFPNSGAYDALDPVSCADGIAMFDDGEMYLTTNGGAIVHSNTSNPDDSSVIFALARKPVSSAAALDAEYAGVLFDASNSDDQRVSPVILGCGNGQCSGQFVSDVAAGTTTGTFFIDLFGSLNYPETGFLTGVVRNEAGETGNLACAVDEDVLASGRNMLSCAGQSPGNNTRLLNIFMVSN